MCSHTIVLIVVALLTLLPFQSSVVCLATVLPIVDSAADFSTCCTCVHLSLAVVFVFTSEMESDTAARNIARYGSFTNESVLYQTCLCIRDFSIQPQTLNNCLRSSFATTNRWSLWSNVGSFEVDRTITYSEPVNFIGGGHKFYG